MTWMVVLQIGVLVVVTGFVIAVLMGTYGELKKQMQAQIVDRIGYEVTSKYLPQVRDMELELTEKMMDMMTEKIPEMMEKVTESTKKIMEEY